MEAFIIEKQKDGLQGSEIIIELLENYKELKEVDAINLLKKMASELQVERGVRKNDIEIKINPGFKTTIQLIPNTTDIIINVENINDIHYLNTIPIYLDSLIRLTQDKKTTSVSAKQIKQLCSGNEKKDLDVLLEDIIMPGEDSFLQTSQGEDDYEDSDDPDKVKNALDMFFGNDYGENEDDSEDGSNEVSKDGSNEVSENESSEKSIESYQEGGEDSSSLSSINMSSSTKGSSSRKGSSSSRSSSTSSSNTPVIEQIKNIEGMRLSNPHIFQERIENRDPVLILKENQGKFNSYSRVCQPNTKQPVILSQVELDRIKKENKGAFDESKGDVIKYGSDPSKQFYYVCPKYWDLQKDTIITQEEIDAKGLRDKIIPKKSAITGKKTTTVQKGKYIYQFYESKEKGYCLPCCFKKWNTKDIIDRRKRCTSKMDEKGEKGEKGELGEKGETSEQRGQEKEFTRDKIKDDYIKGPEKFPLANGRWGYLPIGIQQILKEENSTIKINKPIILRHGVETSRYQSFIACIEDALFYTKTDQQGNSLEINIKEMKKIIISTLTLDNFSLFQNGSLITDFSEPKHNFDMTKLPPLYKNSKLYSKMKNQNPQLFKNICSSFENFISFLKDDNITIDYTYLWDIVCTPNPLLFKTGINLVILEIPNKDTTNDINIICPTNHYSTQQFDDNKPTLVLLYQDNYYEPIYTYREDKSKTSAKSEVFISKLFKETGVKMSQGARSLFDNIVKPFYQKKCIPFASMPNKYKMKTPLLLSVLIDRLKDTQNGIQYKNVLQVINYQDKVIGLIIKHNINKNTIGQSGQTITGFIPCYPSSPDPTMDYEYMSEPSLWTSYPKTITFLLSIYNKSKGSIPCKPVFKIIEDEVVVGILTETNQFIQINPPLPVSEVNDDIPEMRDTNYMIADDAIGTSNGEQDIERIEYIKKIKLETRFFNVFRNTIRMLLNDYKYLKLREEIEQIVNAPYIMYQGKLENASKLLSDLVNSQVVFVDDFDYKLIKEVTTCMNKNKEKCSVESPLCVVNDDGSGKTLCQLVLPKKNLITGANNGRNYFLKMADELIRYSRIKSFIFEPQVYLSFSPLEYNLREDEIIMLQSLITQDYFRDLIPAVENPYVRF